MWSMVAQRLAQITSPAATPDQLWIRVEAAWSAVPQEYIQSLFESMPRRVAALPEPVRQVGLLYDRWQHHLSPPPQFRHRTGGEENILQPPASVVSAATTHKTFGDPLI
ncbi:transposable element Tcb1 transposase [Trichonephila clavipes]|nr:transposable element Tcb1 transposase [Trichonephila clavipes]